MNGTVGERNKYKKGAGKTRFVRNFSKISSGNILGTLFLKFPMVRKNSGFGGKLTNPTMGK